MLIMRFNDIQENIRTGLGLDEEWIKESATEANIYDLATEWIGKWISRHIYLVYNLF